VIFAARGLLVSLAFFAMVYCLLSLLVVLTWRGMKRIRRASVLTSPNFLFGLRIAPFAFSAAVTMFFTLPSFWLLERPSLDEDAATFILALCSLVILGAGLIRVLKAQARTTRAVAQWLIGTTSIGSDASKPVLSASEGAPALIVAGIRRPRVLVSDLAAVVLSDEELRAAVRHELEHVRSWDNLKKASISATPFPWMGGIESAWQEAAELAADDAAVANPQQALDLAAALIKLSRSSRQWPRPMIVTGLLSGSCSISRRVERLLRWRANGQRVRRSWPWSLVVLMTIIVGIGCKYGASLVLTHRLTELLVP
jgi:Zn-dependent protease with chaperone function